MKFYIHYVIWNKESHIDWICDALMFFPRDTVIDFVFDNCTDNSLSRFKNHKITSYYNVSFYESTKKLRCPNTNDAMARFMKSDCDVFLTPQDDMKLQDKHILYNLENLFKNEKNIGMVGMRDGIKNGVKFYSSCHSPGGDRLHTKYLKSGEYQQVDFVNDGPLAMNKNTIDKVGYFDLEYWAHFLDNDYCWRAESAGLRNFVMGAEIVHEKWGNIQQSEVWNQDYSTHDYEVYKTKWANKL